MKRVTCFLLALIMVLSVFPAQIFASAAENVGAAEEGSGVTVSAGAWTGAAATAFARGDGSRERPYIIETPDQLAYLAQSVNGGTTYENRYIHLVADLDMGSITWTPIGTDTNPFKGTFCGNGFTITNLTLGNVALENGLFGKNDGYIKDVHLTNVKASYTATKLTDAYYAQVGALAGVNTGYIERCTASVDITVTCTVSGLDPRVGGLVGCNYRSIVASGTTGSVKLTGGTTNNTADVGGLVGHGRTGECIVNRCYAKTNVTMVNADAAGGLIGYGEGIAVTGCYALGAVSGTSSSSNSRVGGLIGQYYGAGSAAKIQYCFSTGTVYNKASDAAYAGGLIGSYGNFTAGQFTNCYCGASSVKAEVTTVSSSVFAQAGKLIGHPVGTITPVNCYVSSGTTAAYYEHYTYETGGCNSQTVDALREVTGDNSALSGIGTFTYGTNNPATLVGFGGDWVDLSANNPRLAIEDHLNYTVLYYADGQVFSADHACVYPGTEVSFTAPNYADYEPETPVINETVNKEKVVSVYYYPEPHNLMLVCKDADGNVLHTESKIAREGCEYSFAAPTVKGYQPVEATVTGTMGEEDAYVDVFYTLKQYTVKIQYLYLDDTKAAQTYTDTLTYGETLMVESPTVIGHKPNPETAVIDTTSELYEPMTAIDLTVYYTKADEEAYTVVTMLGHERLSNVSVTFNGITKQTDNMGQAVFTYPYGTESVLLKLEKEGYISATYNAETDYTLNTDMGIDYFSMKVNTADNPYYSIGGFTCFGNDIEKDYGTVNVKYDEQIPIVVKANIPENDTITKIQLVQYVAPSALSKDSQTAGSVPDSDLIKKVIQTVENGSAQLDNKGFCTFKVKGTQFSHNADREYPIYVYMYTDRAEDEPFVTKLKINTTQIQTQFKFKGLFEEIEFSLKDTGLSFLENTKVSFELDDKYKANFPFIAEVQNNEVYIAYDLTDEFKDYMKQMAPNEMKLMEAAATRTDSYMKHMANKLDQKFANNKKVKASTTAGFEVDTEFAGGLCFTVRPGSKMEVQSYMKLSLSMKASWQTDFVVIFIPITIRIESNLEGEFTITGLGFDFESQEIVWPDGLSVDIGWNLYVSAGFGNRVLSAGAFGRISISTTLIIGERAYFDALVFNGELGLYARLNCGLFKLYGECSWKFLNKRIELVEQSTYNAPTYLTPEGTYLGEYMGLPVYEASGYTLGSDATVSEEIPDWSVINSVEVVESGIENASERLVPTADGMLAVYFAQDPDRELANAKVLKYKRYFDSTNSWSEEMQVDTNDTADTAFDILSYGGEIYLLYTEANRTFDAEDYTSEADLIYDVTLAQDASLLRYDANTGAFTAVEEVDLQQDDCYDTMPTLGVIDNRLYVCWNKNTARDDTAVFCTNTENNVWVASFDGSSWSSSACVVNNCYPIADMRIVGISGLPRVAIIADEDASLYTDKDRNLYLSDMAGNVTYLKCDNVSTLQTTNGGDTLLWLNNGKIMALDDFDAGMYLFADLAATNYRVTEVSDALTALVWWERDILTEMYVSYRYEDGKWTKPQNLLSSGNHMMSYDAIAVNDTVRLLFTNTHVVTDENTGEQVLNAYSKIFCSIFDLAETLTVVDSSAAVDGDKVNVTVTVTNDGATVIDSITATLTDYVRLDLDSSKDTGNKEEVTFTKLDYDYELGDMVVDLHPGETKTVTFQIDKKSTMVLETYNISVVITEEETGDDTDTDVTDPDSSVSGGVGSGGNTGSGSGGDGNVNLGPGRPSTGGSIGTITPSWPEYIEVRYPDLSVTGQYVIIEETEYISLRIVNNGNTGADATFALYRMEGDQRIEVYSAAITELLPGNAKYYLIKLEKDFFLETVQDFLCLIQCVDDDQQDDNFTYIEARKLEGQAGVNKDLLVEAPVLTDYDQSFDKNPQVSEDLELDITMSDDILSFYGCIDSAFDPVDADYRESADGKTLHVTFRKEHLSQLENGDYTYTFLFQTAAGYIDAVYTLRIADSTPIPLTGTVYITDANGDGISPITEGEKDMMLTVNTQSVNTASLNIAWIIDGNVVSDLWTFAVTEQYLGKTIRAEISGIAPYTGTLITPEIHLNKIARTLSDPVVMEESSGSNVVLKKMFHVGDDTLVYGYSRTSDSADVENWSTSNAIVLPEDGMYYLFVKAPGSNLYEEAVSDPVLYNNTQSLKFSGASLMLQNNLAISYKVKGVALEQSGFEDLHVVFSFNGVETVVRDYTLEGDRYVFTFHNIAPNQMNDTITATLHATYEGNPVAGAPREYSVATYCYTQLNKYSADDYAELRTLLVDLLNYGAVSQQYTGYKTDHLVSAALTETQKSWATQTDRAYTNILTTKYETIENPTVAWKGGSLVLTEAVVMRLRFETDNTEGLSFKITSGGSTWWIDAYSTEGGSTYLYFNGLNAGQMSDEVFITAYQNGAAVSNTVRYSIESYASQKINDTATPYLSEIVDAMMKYGDSAYAYVH